MSLRNALLFFAIFGLLGAGAITYYIVKTSEEPVKPLPPIKLPGSGKATTSQDAAVVIKKKGSLLDFLFPFSPPPATAPGQPSSYTKPPSSRPTPPESVWEKQSYGYKIPAGQATYPVNNTYDTNLTGPTEEIRESLRSQQEASPYAGLIVMSRPITSSYQNVASADGEYLSITSRIIAGAKPVPITGWQIKSVVTGASAKIGKGAYLAYPGQLNPESEIFLSPGGRAVVATGRSPIGVSFRLNKCTGYFAQYQTFTPTLPEQCPALQEESLPKAPNALDDRCLDYIDRLPICRTHGKLPIYLKPECTTYIAERTNYNFCVSAHKNDPDFYLNEWRIYLNRDDRLWKNRRETIKLIDNEGKTVTAVSY